VQLGERWRALPEAEKQQYNKEGARLVAEWKANFAKWEAEQSPEALHQFARLRREGFLAPKFSKKRKFAQLPKPSTDLRKPRYPFFYFLKDCVNDEKWLEGAPDDGLDRGRWITHKAGQQWRALSTKEKEPYEIRRRLAEVPYTGSG